MLLLPMALAADLTWTCPELTATEDAYPWSTPTALGALDAFGAVIATAYAAIPEECLATCGSTVDGYCSAVDCVSSAGDVVYWRYGSSDWTDEDHNSGTNRSIAFDIAPTDQGWTSLVGSYSYVYEDQGTKYSWGYWTRISGEATWVGTLRDAWPPDRTIRVSLADAWAMTHSADEVRESESWDDGSCVWSADYVNDRVWSREAWDVTVGAHEVAVTMDLLDCPTELQGSLDGVSVGVVERVGWTNAASDADDDGVSAGRYDCDDADPDVNVCADDLLADGIDQDCDGEDGEDGDADGDGFASVEVGGTDCDDDADETWPGATELCDGHDNNCDGVGDDLADQDRDTWSVCEGDCDDNQAARYPGAPEVCDGIDNDCDGAVEAFVDEDGDGYDACAGECDDADPEVNPGAAEVADGIDNDCNGFIDEGTSADTGDSDPEAPEDTGLKAGGCEGGGASAACTTGGGSARSVAGVLVALAWGARRRLTRA